MESVNFVCQTNKKSQCTLLGKIKNFFSLLMQTQMQSLFPLTQTTTTELLQAEVNTLGDFLDLF